MVLRKNNRDRGCYIHNLSDGDPAKLLGLRVADQLACVDGISVVTHTFHDTVALLKATESPVRLEFRRLGVADASVPLTNLGKPMCFAWKRSYERGQSCPGGAACVYGHPHMPFSRMDVTVTAVEKLSPKQRIAEVDRLGLSINAADEDAVVGAITRARVEERAAYLVHADRIRELDRNRILYESKPTVVSMAGRLGLNDQGTREALADAIVGHLEAHYGVTGRALEKAKANSKKAAKEREEMEGKAVNQRGEVISLPSAAPHHQEKHNQKKKRKRPDGWSKSGPVTNGGPNR